ncbi:hypothetical protein E1B28_004364 [Marasmius oreades]|uniref:Pentatricopeptide repeat-containing protein n=1 Tax=Marasmius oreades TaxID=181124 RepID=A0A9P7UYH5_9AGAR|nr:uncharacterized protein E1B28_004364 [Marasmius oreades]KAG7096967.1 hypothetical protein E1B28_004364 [Marasmius oreades]
MLRYASHHARRNLTDSVFDFSHFEALPNSLLLHRHASTARITKDAVTDSEPKRYRSKHYDSLGNTTLPKKLLEPHVLSTRLKTFCGQGKIEAAISALKHAPLDAQNVPVWNTLIWECMKAERFKQAYDLYIDMKRRGFGPNTRTFITMLNGYSRIENWKNYPKQLRHTKSLYEAFQRHLEYVKDRDPTSAELDISAIASYIRILGCAGLNQEIFDVCYAMDSSGPLSPNHIIFTAMFRALSSTPDPDTDYVSNAASAKLLWSLMLKHQRKSQFPIDDHLASAAIFALARGRPTDQKLAFGITREYFGLEGPGETRVTPKLQLNPQAFAAVLALCRFSKNWLHAIHFFESVSKGTSSSIVDRNHIETVIHAHTYLKNPASGPLQALEWLLDEHISQHRDARLRPTHSTFMSVLHACHASSSNDDWRCATRTFDLMTGYHCHDFMDGSVSDNPRFDQRSPGRNIQPTAESVSLMLRIALAIQNCAHIRQVLRLTHHIGLQKLCLQEKSVESKKDREFYSLKLADGVVSAVDDILADNKGKDQPHQEDIARWMDLKGDANHILESQFKVKGGLLRTIRVKEKDRDRRIRSRKP